jgi:alpha-N-arabinofuranosidase
VDAWQWTPDLIWVNNLAVLPTANYYVQQLFSRNRGDKVLPTTLKDEASQTSGTTGQASQLFASATRENTSGEIILKVANAANSTTEAEIKLETTTAVAGRAETIVLTGAGGAAMNTFEQPRNVVPVESIVQDASNAFRHTFPANSMTVMRLKGQ